MTISLFSRLAVAGAIIREKKLNRLANEFAMRKGGERPQNKQSQRISLANVTGTGIIPFPISIDVGNPTLHSQVPFVRNVTYPESHSDYPCLPHALFASPWPTTTNWYAKGLMRYFRTKGLRNRRRSQ